LKRGREECTSRNCPLRSKAEIELYLEAPDQDHAWNMRGERPGTLRNLIVIIVSTQLPVSKQEAVARRDLECRIGGTKINFLRTYLCQILSPPMFTESESDAGNAEVAVIAIRTEIAVIEERTEVGGSEIVPGGDSKGTTANPAQDLGILTIGAIAIVVVLRRKAAIEPPISGRAVGSNKPPFAGEIEQSCLRGRGKG